MDGTFLKYGDIVNIYSDSGPGFLQSQGYEHFIFISLDSPILADLFSINQNRLNSLVEIIEISALKFYPDSLMRLGRSIMTFKR